MQMDYELQELFRIVGTNGVTQEKVISLVTEYLAIKVKMNIALREYRDEQMAKNPTATLGRLQDHP